MRKIIVMLVLMLIPSLINAKVTEYIGPGTKYIDIVNESVISKNALVWTFKGCSDKSLIDFTETSKTTMNVRYLLPSGAIASSVNMTKGIPIAINGYDTIECRIYANSATNVTMNGSIRIYNNNLIIQNSVGMITTLNPVDVKNTIPSTVSSNTYTITALNTWQAMPTVSTSEWIEIYSPEGVYDFGTVTLNATTNKKIDGLARYQKIYFPSTGAAAINVSLTVVTGNVQVNYMKTKNY